MTINGTVEISLQDYEKLLYLKKHNQELLELLEEEKNKTRKLFGNLLIRENLQIETSYDIRTDMNRYVLCVKTPITRLEISKYEFEESKWNKIAIFKELSNLFLHDMVQSFIDAIALNKKNTKKD